MHALKQLSTFHIYLIAGVVYTVALELFFVAPYSYRVYQIYKIRHTRPVQARGVTLTLVPVICAIIFIAIEQPWDYFLRLVDAQPGPILQIVKYWFRYYLAWGTFCGFALRAWIVYFDIQLYRHEHESKWIHIVTSDEHKTNWFMTHRHTLGNKKLLAKVLYSSLVVLVIPEGILAYVENFGPISVLWENVVGVIVSTFAVVCLWRTPRFNDVFDIRSETYLAAYLLFFGLFVAALFRGVLAARYGNSHKELLLLVENVLEMVSCAFVWAMTRKVTNEVDYWTFCGMIPMEVPGVPGLDDMLSLSKFLEARARIKSQEAQAEMSAINPEPSPEPPSLQGTPSPVISPREDSIPVVERHHRKQSSHSLHLPIGIFPTSPRVRTPKRQTTAERLSLCLQHRDHFFEFSDHVMREWSIENICYIVEWSQYQTLLSHRYDFGCSREGILRVKITKNAPKSKIVHGSLTKKQRQSIGSKNERGDEVLRLRMLYEKYIKMDSAFELNISYDLRKGISKLFEGQDGIETSAVDMMTPKELAGVFDEATHEALKLLRVSFTRFIPIAGDTLSI